MHDDDSEPETAGTDEDAPGADRERGDDEYLLGTDPDPEAIDEPTTDSAQEAREARWALQEGLAIGIVSIFAGVLVAFGLMQATGLIDLPGPIGDSPLAHWTLFVALGAILLAAFAWSQRGT